MEIQIAKKYGPNKLVKATIPFLLLIAIILWAGWMCGIHLEELNGIFTKTLEVVSWMMPPDISALKEFVIPIMETMLYAFLGTIFGAVMSLIVAFGAASNIAPKLLRSFCRFLISLERAVPEILVALILMAGLGPGVFTGVLALSISCVGMLGRLFADSIEEVEQSFIESFQSLGANKVQIILYGLIPQVFPSIISNTIFRFEINLRVSVLLGAVGVGGIGYELMYAFSLAEYERAFMAVIMIFIVVFATERVSELIRSRLLDTKKLK